jgi:hypothetical protein
MSGMQRIIYRGRLAAVVLADQAILTDPLPEQHEREVRAMCLYALEVAAGLQPGPYSDERALQYARRAGLDGPQ